MTTVLGALAEPHRRRILDLLVDREHTVGELVAHFELSQPAVSKHLKVLRDVGMVSARVDGPRRLYRLHYEPLIELDRWLESYRKRWLKTVDHLEEYLETMSDDTRGVLP